MPFPPSLPPPSPLPSHHPFPTPLAPNREDQENTQPSFNPSMPPPSHGPPFRAPRRPILRSASAGRLLTANADRAGRPDVPPDAKKRGNAKPPLNQAAGHFDLRPVRSECTQRRSPLDIHFCSDSIVARDTLLDLKASGDDFANERMREKFETPVPNNHQNFTPQVLEPYNWLGKTDGDSNGECGSRYRGSYRPNAVTRQRFCRPKSRMSSGGTDIERSVFGGQLDVKAVDRPRKRPLNEDLETLKDETMQGQGTRIMVCVRLRPMSKAEKEEGARICVRVENKRDIYLTEFALETDYLKLKRLRGRHFAFDAVFADNTGQQEVYNISTAELVEGVLQGKNGSVFCYGATGAGKTHTMLGTVQNPGVMVLALKDLFTKLRERSKEGDYVVHLSYLEVYNESVRDLLSPGRPLILRQDSKQGTVASGITQYQAYSADEVMTLLQQGNQNRMTKPTCVNETSSRSHAILQVVAEYKVQQEAGFISQVGKLSLIDLAGSERALATDSHTLRSLEGANINRSLLALSSCINALVEGKKHIPFRNSKLTQLLKDSLGGACRTSMIANISPSNLSFGETQNTLHWADRAKEIKTKVCITNEELQIPESRNEQAKLLMELQKENLQLRMQLARLQQKLLAVQSTVIAQSSTMAKPITACPASPFTPMRPANEMDYHSSSPVYCTPESNLLQNEERNEEWRILLEQKSLIQDLQRTVEVLEKEREQVQRDFSLQQEQLSESLAALNDQQLRGKDDSICMACQRSLAKTGPATTKALIVATDESAQHPANPMHEGRSHNQAFGHFTATVTMNRMSSELMPITRRETPTISRQEDRDHTQASRMVTTTPITSTMNQASMPPTRREADVLAPSAATPAPLCRFVIPKVSSKHYPLPPAGCPFLIPESDQQTRTDRLLRTLRLPVKVPLVGLCSPSKKSFSIHNRKRAFWDVTNACCPSSVGSHQLTRINTDGTTPSILLQVSLLLFSSGASPFKRIVSCFDYICRRGLQVVEVNAGFYVS